MKKTVYLLWLFAVMASLQVFGKQADPVQEGRTRRNFTAVASNVDGLPPSVHINYGLGSADPTMNEDGSQEPGATRMGQLFADRLWDIVALSEDFNYHNYIIDGVKNYYNASKYRGKIEQSNLNNLAGYLNKTAKMMTDGLCLLTRKTSKVLTENIVSWNDHYGYTDHEADGLIDKGYRFYQICLEGNLIVDVYIMHMDAGSDQGDIDARTSQLKQLCKAIKDSNNGNPIIILGDTNCRYTRDTVKADLIDPINADPRFDIHDPWVECRRGFNADGTPNYTKYGDPDLTVGQKGEQDGEVVDKVWFINTAGSECRLMYTYGTPTDQFEYAEESQTCSYLHDDGFTYADGSQIADHYPVVAYLTIEGPATPPPPAFEIPESEASKAEKKAIESGKAYYIRNVGSGEFIRAGGAWTTQAVMGDYASKVIPQSKGGDKYALQTTFGNKYMEGGGDVWMDHASNNWTLTQVTDAATPNIYTMQDASGNPIGIENGVLHTVGSSNPQDPYQQWEFLTENNLRYELYSATSDDPKDVTFLMTAPDFCYGDASWPTQKPGSNAKYESNQNNGNRKVNNGKVRYENNNSVSFYKVYNDGGLLSDNRKWDLGQTITGLPAGTYKVTYQVAAYNLGDNHKFTINGDAASFTYLGSSDPGGEVVAKNLADGQYAHEVMVIVKDDGDYANKIVINVAKETTTSATGAYYDNFKIKCIGIEGKIDMSVYERVKTAIDDAYEKAGELGIALNNRGVETLYNNYEINGDGWNEVNRTYKNLAEAVLQRTEIPCDYTYALVNNSFELYPDYKDSRYPNMEGGYPFGWTYPNKVADDSGVWPKTNNDKRVDNAHEDYLFNTYVPGDWGGNPLCQEIALTPGIYELKALVTSEPGNTVYIYAGNDRASIKIPETGNRNKFEEVTLHFPVSEGKPFNIGVAGGDDNGNFTMDGGRWYKADNFRLRRIGAQETIEGMRMLEFAIKDVKAKAPKYGATPDLSRYEAMLSNYTLTGDGKQEFNEVYDLLRELIYAQSLEGNKDISYTDAIVNPSFEGINGFNGGNLYGWDLMSTENNEIGAKQYNIKDRDGAYVFNAWTDGGWGTVISQTIANLPAGSYVLTAKVADGENQYAYLEVTGGDMAPQRSIFQPVGKDNDGSMQTLEFIVTDGTPSIKIAAGGCNSDGTWSEVGGTWYKVDDFQLYRKVSPNVCLFYQQLQRAIAEANEVVYGNEETGAKGLPEPYRSKWSGKIYDDMLEAHLADGHDPENNETGNLDPNNLAGSGGRHIKELYTKLRELVFSQKEAGADMTGAITNNSFELGDLTGWTVSLPMNADARVTEELGAEGRDGKYLYNCYYQWPAAKGRPISQVIPDVPAGRYTLKVKIASYEGRTFVIAANDQHSDIIEFHGDESHFNDYSFTFEVPKELKKQDVKIGVYPTSKTKTEDLTEADFADDVEGSWYKVDDFRLTLESRWLEVYWRMETPTHGTIMLPFEVSGDELAQKKLEAYTITISDESHTPADKAVNNYRLIGFEGPHEKMKANVPYVLKNVENEEEAPATPETNSVMSAKAAETETPADPQANYTGKYYRFEGYSVINDVLVDNEHATLTGTLENIEAKDGQHHLAQVNDESSVGFMAHKEYGSEGEIIPAYHAYMFNPVPDYRNDVDGFYFYEPIQKIEWKMETPTHGTLILPFDAALPSEFTAYRLTGVSDSRNVSISAPSEGTYQVIETTEVTEKAKNEDGSDSELVQLRANTPYFITLNVAKNVKKVRPLAEGTESVPNPGATFSGDATNEEAEYKDGLLTGVFVSRDDNVDDTQNSLETGHVLKASDDGPLFQTIETRTAVPAYHAYINHEDVKSPYLLFEDYTNKITWTMENADFGTIVVPVDWTLPDGYEAYEVASFEELKDYDNNFTYQVISQENALTAIEANKPYLIMKKVATEETPATQAEAQVDGGGRLYEEFSWSGEQNGSTPVDNGALVGTYSTVKSTEGDYVVTNSENSANGFIKERGDVSVDAFHAYIPASKVPEVNGETPDYLILASLNEDIITGVEEIMAGDVNVDIYTLDGALVRRDVKAAKALQELDHGIYILRSVNGTVKVIK